MTVTLRVIVAPSGVSVPVRTTPEGEKVTPGTVAIWSRNRFVDRVWAVANGCAIMAGVTAPSDAASAMPSIWSLRTDAMV